MSTNSSSFHCMQHIPVRLPIASIGTYSIFRNPSMSDIHLPVEHTRLTESRSTYKIELDLSALFSNFLDYCSEPPHLMQYVPCCMFFTSVVDSAEMITGATFATRHVTIILKPVSDLSLTNALHATSSGAASCIRHEYLWYCN